MKLLQLLYAGPAQQQQAGLKTEAAERKGHYVIFFKKRISLYQYGCGCFKSFIEDFIYWNIAKFFSNFLISLKFQTSPVIVTF